MDAGIGGEARNPDLIVQENFSIMSRNGRQSSLYKSSNKTKHKNMQTENS